MRNGSAACTPHGRPDRLRTAAAWLAALAVMAFRSKLRRAGNPADDPGEAGPGREPDGRGSRSNTGRATPEPGPDRGNPADASREATSGRKPDRRNQSADAAEGTKTNGEARANGMAKANGGAGANGRATQNRRPGGRNPGGTGTDAGKRHDGRTGAQPPAHQLRKPRGERGHHANGTLSATDSERELTPEIRKRIRYWSTEPERVSVTHNGVVTAHRTGGADIVARVLGTHMERTATVLVWRTPHETNRWETACPAGETPELQLNAHRVNIQMDQNPYVNDRKLLRASAGETAEALGGQVTRMIGLFAEFTVETPCPQGDQAARIAHLDRLLGTVADREGVSKITATYGGGTLATYPLLDEGRPGRAQPGQPREIWLHPRQERLLLHAGSRTGLDVRAITQEGQEVRVLFEPGMEINVPKPYGSALDTRSRTGTVTVPGNAQKGNFKLAIRYRGRSYIQNVTVVPRVTAIEAEEGCMGKTAGGRRYRLDAFQVTAASGQASGKEIADETGGEYLSPMYDPANLGRSKESHLIGYRCESPEDHLAIAQALAAHPGVASFRQHEETEREPELSSFLITDPTRDYLLPQGALPVEITVHMTDGTLRKTTLGEISDWEWETDTPHMLEMTEDGRLGVRTPGRGQGSLTISGITRELAVEAEHFPQDSRCRTWREEGDGTFSYSHMDRLTFIMRPGAARQGPREEAARRAGRHGNQGGRPHQEHAHLDSPPPLPGSGRTQVDDSGGRGADQRRTENAPGREPGPGDERQAGPGCGEEPTRGPGYDGTHAGQPVEAGGDPSVPGATGPSPRSPRKSGGGGHGKSGRQQKPTAT